MFIISFILQTMAQQRVIDKTESDNKRLIDDVEFWVLYIILHKISYMFINSIFIINNEEKLYWWK